MTIPKTKWPSIIYTVWDEAWLALTQPRQYVRWAYQPFRRSLAYLSILLGILAIAITSYFYLNIRPQLKEAQVWLGENVPQVVFAGGKMSVAGDASFLLSDNEDFFFKVDPTEALDDTSIDSFYRLGIMVVTDGVYVRSGEDIEKTTFADLGIQDTAFTGHDMASRLGKFIGILSVIAPFLVFIYLLVTNLLLSLFASFLFYLFGGLRAPLVSLWSMALYALTPALLAGYLSVIFLPIAGLSTLVFLIYLTLAVINFHRFLDFQSKYQNAEKK